MVAGKSELMWYQHSGKDPFDCISIGEEAKGELAHAEGRFVGTEARGWERPGLLFQQPAL